MFPYFGIDLFQHLNYYSNEAIWIKKNKTIFNFA